MDSKYKHVVSVVQGKMSQKNDLITSKNKYYLELRGLFWPICVDKIGWLDVLLWHSMKTS